MPVLERIIVILHDGKNLRRDMDIEHKYLIDCVFAMSVIEDELGPITGNLGKVFNICQAIHVVIQSSDKKWPSSRLFERLKRFNAVLAHQ
jgi:hypothetical protein